MYIKVYILIVSLESDPDLCDPVVLVVLPGVVVVDSDIVVQHVLVGLVDLEDPVWKLLDVDVLIEVLVRKVESCMAQGIHVLV